jgi:hypothetical protein
MLGHDGSALPLLFPGVTDIRIDMDGQKIEVDHEGEVTADDLLATLQKWGSAANKAVSLAE